MYDDTPAPLNAEPTLMPSTFTRPSLLRPPAPPNTTMPGTTCASVAAPAWVTVFGISCIRLLYERDDGIDVMMSLSSTVCRLHALHVDDRRLAGDGDRLLERADAQVGVDRGRERARQRRSPSRLTVLNPAA